ncbi:hypothetical protein CEXT_367851 [Caerostris extrusa]|uniref:Uncharacterized protein n=1 Tax=Caerostris extrusa TaxID=172846 RepID=A0AAV4NAX9_CAEEX|nr:hypothetical protein CEXT_367851 [Caerostris extrusa]
MNNLFTSRNNKVIFFSLRVWYETFGRQISPHCRLTSRVLRGFGISRQTERQLFREAGFGTDLFIEFKGGKSSSQKIKEMGKNEQPISILELTTTNCFSFPVGDLGRQISPHWRVTSRRLRCFGISCQTERQLFREERFGTGFM